MPQPLVESLFSVCYTNSYDELEVKVRELLVEGYSVSQMLLQLHDMLVTMETITDAKKSVIAERMGVSPQFSRVHHALFCHMTTESGAKFDGWC